MQHCSTTWLWWLLISLAGALASCETPPEYKESPTGYRWKLLSFQDKSVAMDSAEHVFAEITILDQTRRETLFYEFDRLFTVEDGSIFSYLTNRNVGDGLELIAKKPDELNEGLAMGDSLFYRIRIDRMRTAEDLENERLSELMNLDSLVRTDSVRTLYTEWEGVYFRKLEEGDTTRVRRGKEIVIHYRGRKTDGTVFDDSRRMVAPLRFVYGTEGQVLPGIAVALSRMRKGEIAEVILPSWMAFGSRGSADGRVRPYTTVIYRIEVLRVAE